MVKIYSRIIKYCNSWGVTRSWEFTSPQGFLEVFCCPFSPKSSLAGVLPFLGTRRYEVHPFLHCLMRRLVIHSDGMSQEVTSLKITSFGTNLICHMSPIFLNGNVHERWTKESREGQAALWYCTGNKNLWNEFTRAPHEVYSQVRRKQNQTN